MSSLIKQKINAIVVAGLIVGILDGIDAIVAYKLVLDFDPIPIYQFVASGMLGPSAFAGGIGTALIGLGVHFLVAFAAAAFFIIVASGMPWLIKNIVISGLAYGVGVWAFMNYVIIPLSLIPPSPFNLALFLNGVISHALLVGLPISIIAKRMQNQ